MEGEGVTSCCAEIKLSTAAEVHLHGRSAYAQRGYRMQVRQLEC